MLEWVAYPFSSRYSWPRNRTRISYITGGCFTNSAMREGKKLVQPVWKTGFAGGSAVKNPPAMQEMQVRSLGQEGLLEKEMATHSSILAWRIPVDRGAWRATVHGVSKSQTQLKWLSMHTPFSKQDPSSLQCLKYVRSFVSVKLSSISLSCCNSLKKSLGCLMPSNAIFLWHTIIYIPIGYIYTCRIILTLQSCLFPINLQCYPKVEFISLSLESMLICCFVFVFT